MEFALCVVFAIAFVASVVCSVWSTKMTCKEERLKTVATYNLSLELKRYNDNTFGVKENEPD